MTGSDHYHEAEIQAESAESEINEGRTDEARLSLALGQLHATLALAAATGVNSASKDERQERQWVRGRDMSKHPYANAIVHLDEAELGTVLAALDDAADYRWTISQASCEHCNRLDRPGAQTTPGTRNCRTGTPRSPQQAPEGGRPVSDSGLEASGLEGRGHILRAGPAGAPGSGGTHY